MTFPGVTCWLKHLSAHMSAVTLAGRPPGFVMKSGSRRGNVREPDMPTERRRRTRPERASFSEPSGREPCQHVTCHHDVTLVPTRVVVLVSSTSRSILRYPKSLETQLLIKWPDGVIPGHPFMLKRENGRQAGVHLLPGRGPGRAGGGAGRAAGAALVLPLSTPVDQGPASLVTLLPRAGPLALEG